MIEVMSELKKIADLYKKGELTRGLEELDALWKRIPEPKTETANAYLVVEYSVAFALGLRKLDEAKKWAALAPSFIEKRQDRGEVEFLVGKVAFECGEIEVAKQSFTTAQRKSRGRILQGQDPRYRALIESA